MTEKTTDKMTVQMEQEYKKSLEFWDQSMAQQEETQTQEAQETIDLETAWYEVGSRALADAAASLATQKKVLDYGCGSGWASVIMAKKGCPQITAVDVSANGVKASQEYATLFHVESNIEFQAIPTDWLKQEESEKYDGLFCSNVLDVIPRSVSEEIIKEAARICTKDAKIIIGLNPCFTEEQIEKRNMIELEKNHYSFGGVLRLVNYTDEEWTNRFSQYFDVKEIEYFRWDGEPDVVKRRLFHLTKR